MAPIKEANPTSFNSSPIPIYHFHFEVKERFQLQTFTPDFSPYLSLARLHISIRNQALHTIQVETGIFEPRRKLPMAPTYSLSLSKYNGPDNNIVWLPGSVGFVLRVTCSGTTTNEDPFKDVGITCNTETKDGAGYVTSLTERWYSIDSSFASTNRRAGEPISVVIALLTEIKEVGTVGISFCVQKRLPDGRFQPLNGSPLVVDRKIRTASLEQVKRETEAELGNM
ncbi:predicted protein [Histoplasma capsulatum H143]|uniref:Uncharacterized protein n=2 Tax=Ajellomyces capsulatus TaxID=5037 RepID=C6HAZ1_AJECH|nr:predicted protein [Histoplasma capsulatum H143]